MIIRKQHALLMTFAAAASAALAAQTSAPAQPAATKPRVFFVEPKDKAVVTSPVNLKFGSEGITISAVPVPDPAKPRPGVAHYHLGIDQDCLPPGKNIVKGTPSWVHFGDGKDVFTLQLPPGEHKLALQLGDDLHNTMPETCEVITVTVK
jgi:hypothetical protein